MGPGLYLVVNGGSNETVNAHFLTSTPKTERQRAYRGQSFAVDLIKINAFGLRADGWRPRDPPRYQIFGEEVFTPCPGTIVSAQKDRPDMPVPEVDQTLLEGNHVLVDCGDFAVLLAHLRQGTTRVEVGDEVTRGQIIGEAGNSGQTGEPHLHIHVQKLGPPGALLSGEPLQLTLEGDFLVRNDRIHKARL